MADYKVIGQKGAGGWLDKKCFWCGEYFKKDEAIALIIPDPQSKKTYKRISCNIVMHADEFNQLATECNGNKDEIIARLGKSKQPRKKFELSEEQRLNIEAFRYACDCFRIRVETGDKGVVKRRQSGSSLTVEYNALTNRIHTTTRGKRSIIDNLMISELSAKIYNKMHEKLGDGKYDDFTAAGVMEKAVDTVNGIMK